MITPTEHPYIVRQEGILGGEPTIKGSRVPVRAIIEEWRLGYTPEEMVRAHPHLNLAQIFDALSYYQDHMDEINEYIARNRVTDEMIRESHERMMARKRERNKAAA